MKNTSKGKIIFFEGEESYGESDAILHLCDGVPNKLNFEYGGNWEVPISKQNGLFVIESKNKYSDEYVSARFVAMQGDYSGIWIENGDRFHFSLDVDKYDE